MVLRRQKPAKINGHPGVYCDDSARVRKASLGSVNVSLVGFKRFRNIVAVLLRFVRLKH